MINRQSQTYYDENTANFEILYTDMYILGETIKFPNYMDSIKSLHQFMNNIRIENTKESTMVTDLIGFDLKLFFDRKLKYAHFSFQINADSISIFDDTILYKSDHVCVPTNVFDDLLDQTIHRLNELISKDQFHILKEG